MTTAHVQAVEAKATSDWPQASPSKKSVQHVILTIAIDASDLCHIDITKPIQISQEAR